ncbi:MAG: hypothetical protein GXP08_08545 [Gammaproteobacteria bacterium]|nr:hypothetical protein [Gammaproteobacteria bacterium]
MKFVGIAVLPVLCGFLSQPSIASTFENELAFYLESSDRDVKAASVDENAFGVNFTKYLTPVGDENYPLEEANFFARSRNVNAGVGFLDTDFDSANGDGYIIEIGYQHLEKTSPIGFELGYETSDSSVGRGNTAADITQSELLFNVYYYLTDNTRLGLGYLRQSADIDANVGQSSSDSNIDAVVLRTKTVNQYDGSWVNVEGQLIYSQLDDDNGDTNRTTLAVDGDYYFNRKVSLGAGLAATSGDNNSDSNRFSVDIVFHTDTGYAFIAAVEKVDSDSGADENVIRFSFVSRNF